MFAEMYAWDNLLLAYRRAAKGKRGHPNVAAFEHDLEGNLYQLQAELRAMTYLPGAYVNFTIHEPKQRLISAAPFRDRVVHHALCNLIEPIYERSFVVNSYANRVGKGTHRALDRVQALARRYPYVWQCDVRQFFPSIDHTLLRDMLASKVADPQVRWLMDRILAGGAGVLRDAYDMQYFFGDDLFAPLRPRGLPVGNLTSQFWANVYLNGFDHFIVRQLRCRGYVRFVDDLLFFADDKPSLWAWQTAVVARLRTLRLTIHPGSHPRPVGEGIPFLGFVVWPHRRRLKRRKVVAYRRVLRRLIADYRAGRLRLAQVSASVRGWVNHASHANTDGLRKALFRRHPLRTSRPSPPEVS
ncbi:MAG: reverse transcriptase domain-containing protein [Anaerolineae bacterium]